MRQIRFMTMAIVVSAVLVGSEIARAQDVSPSAPARAVPVGQDAGRGTGTYPKLTPVAPRIVGSDCGTDYECDDGNACTIDTCESFTCVNTPAPAQSPCDLDGNLCSVDVCDGSGACVFQGNTDCSFLGDACTHGECDAFTGLCVIKPKGPGTPCELDGNLCTWDVCDGDGTCVFDGNVPCSGSQGPCDAGKICEPETGDCVELPDPGPETSCDRDDDLCTHDVCDGTGVCVFDNDVTCDGPTGPCDGGQACDPGSGTCVDLPDVDAGTECESDDNLCTIEVCNDQGQCVVDGEVTCAEPAGPCGGGEICEPETGVCVPLPNADPGTPCDTDSDLCSNEICDEAGACVFDSEVTCSEPTGPCDGGQECDPQTGTCVDLPDATPGTACESDENLCTNEVCDDTGACVYDSEVTCLGPVGPCDAGQACDAQTGTCVDLPDVSPGTPCETDDDLCTNEVCDNTGACVVDSEVTCSEPTGPCDGGQACEPITGTCVDLPDADPGTACESDGDLCTNEVCDDTGACVFDSDVTCPGPLGPCDGGQACDAQTGTCVDLPDANPGTPCETDDDLCTNEVCDDTGACVVDSEVSCDGPSGPCDGGQECDPNTGTCVDLPNPPDGTSCEDGLYCNGAETCQSGVCAPGENPCQSNEPCVSSVCDEAQDSCSEDCAQPGITCPDDLVFECDVANPDFGDPVIDDPCSITPVVACVEDHQPGKLPQEEHITRTCTITNDCGNSAQCSYTIDIVDTTPPEVTCPPDLEFECDAVGDFGEPIVSDNCDANPDVTIEVTTVTNDCVPTTAGVVIPPKFTTTRKVTVTDGTTALASGNTGNVTECIQTINIFDTTPPTFPECPTAVNGCIGDPLEFTPPTCEDTCGDCSVQCTRSDGRPLTAPIDSADVTISCIAYDDCLNASADCTIGVDTNACNIPTVSEWGLAVLALLLLIGGKLYFGRRSSLA